MKPKITVNGGQSAKVSEQTKKRIRDGLNKLEIIPRPEIPAFEIVTEYPRCEHFTKRKIDKR